MADVLIKFTPVGVDETTRGLTTLGERLERLETVGEGATRGSRMLETALFDLSSKAADLSSGPLRQLIEGIAQFSGGAPFVLGITAGIGAIGGAFEALTSQLKDVSTWYDNAKKSAEEFNRQHAGSTASLESREQTRDALGERIGQIQDAIERAQATRTPTATLVGSLRLATEAYGRNEQAIAAETGAAAGEHAEAIRRSPAGRLAVEEQDAWIESIAGASAGRVERAFRPFQTTFERPLGPWNSRFRLGGVAPTEPPEGTIFRADEPLPGRDFGEHALDWRRAGGAATALAGAVRGGGGPAAFLQTGAGIASAAGQPEVGAGLEVVSALTSFFGSGKHRVVVTNLEQDAVDKLKETSVAPPNMTVSVAAGGRTAAEAAYGLQRASQLDAIPTVPYATP